MLHINKIRGMVKINAAQKSQLGCRYYLIQIVALQKSPDLPLFPSQAT